MREIIASQGNVKSKGSACEPSDIRNKNRRKIVIVLSLLLVVTLITTVLHVFLVQEPSKPDLFVGVDVGWGDENTVYEVADAVQGYANLIIIGSLNVTRETENLTRVCDYLYQRGFYFIVFVSFSTQATAFPPQGPDQDFFNKTAGRWGDRLLGVYIFDEPGGKQLDEDPDLKIIQRASNNTDAAIHYILSLEPYAALYKGKTYYSAPWLTLYTSDYALHWYDHLSGYDVVLGQFVGNQSRQLAVALTRGAAETLGGGWGIMITWKYEQPPYLEEAEQLYDDMVLAYENGAEYIVVFNSPDVNDPITPLGILTDKHLDAIKRFWNHAKENPRAERGLATTAYVLPADYGFGFRGPSDTIWGFWPSNETSTKLWTDVNALLETYGKDLDIAYENRTDGVPANVPHKRLIFWNGTTIEK